MRGVSMPTPSARVEHSLRRFRQTEPVGPKRDREGRTRPTGPTTTRSQEEQEELDQALLTAAEDGNVEALRRALAEGASLDAKWPSEVWFDVHPTWTALHCAAYQGHTDALKALIKAGAILDAKSGSGWTALMQAAYFDKTGATKALIAAGANLEAQKNDGVTALMLAAADGHTESLEALIKAGAKLEAKSDTGWTALMFACTTGNAFDALKVLLEAKANLEAKDNEGKTALMFVNMFDTTAELKALIAAGANLEAQDNDGVTALITAAAKGLPQVMKALIEAGANLEATNREGETVLTRASKHRDADDIVKVLFATVSSAEYQALAEHGLSRAWFAELPRHIGEHRAAHTATILAVCEGLPDGLRLSVEARLADGVQAVGARIDLAPLDSKTIDRMGFFGGLQRFGNQTTVEVEDKASFALVYGWMATTPNFIAPTAMHSRVFAETLVLAHWIDADDADVVERLERAAFLRAAFWAEAHAVQPFVDLAACRVVTTLWGKTADEGRAWLSGT